MTSMITDDFKAFTQNTAETTRPALDLIQVNFSGEIPGHSVN